MKKSLLAASALVAVVALIAAPAAAYAEEVIEPTSETVVVEEVVAPAPEVVVIEVPAEPVVEAAPVVEEAAPVVAEVAPVVEVASKGGDKEPNEGVCQPQADHQSPTADDDLTVETVTAPEGKLISGYCVKAGSIKQGNGPEYVVLETPVAEVTFSHSSGKDISHFTVTYVDAPPIEVTPRACVGVGAWYTEGDDLPPVATPEGLLFQGGTGKAVGIRVPVDGNLQGWSSVSFTNIGGTEQFFFRIVIDASADGGPAYKSLSFPGYTTIDSASISYQYGESIAATAERFPNAVIKSVGFQTNSGAPADYSAVLQTVTGPCASADFTYDVPDQPADRVVVVEETEVDCETGIATTTTTTSTYGTTYDAQTNTWVENAEPSVEVIVTEREATEEECPTVVVPPVDEEPIVEPTPTEEPLGTGGDDYQPTALAVTGSDNGWIGWSLGGAAALLAGISLWAFGQARRQPGVLRSENAE